MLKLIKFEKYEHNIELSHLSEVQYNEIIQSDVEVIMKYTIFIPEPYHTVDIPFLLNPIEHIEMECWCDDHCSTIEFCGVFKRQAKYSYRLVFSSMGNHSTKYFFEKEEDAMWFKLRWSI